MKAASSHEFNSKLLQRAKSDKAFGLYRAALEWGLAEPIVIESREDFKSEFRWKDRLEPFHHQVENLITFCRRLPVALLADDVGLGKTISAGLVASELIARSRVSKILIVAPKILGAQWQDELKTKFDISSTVVVGNKLMSADPEDSGAIITTYQSARSYLEKIPDDRFDMLILDEAHKLRNLYGVKTTPQVAKVFERALKQHRFRYVLMLTATPIQNRLWDIYSLVDLLAAARGHENPFGSEGEFSRKFITDNSEKARELNPHARDDFRKIVYSYMSRVRRGDAKLDFPERKILLHRVTPSAPELALIDVIAEEIQGLFILAQISVLQALTSSPHALMAQLDNMAKKGTVSSKLAASVRAIVTPMKTSAKLEGLGQLVTLLKEQNPTGWRMVVFTGRRETQTSIQIYLEELGIKVGIINGSSGARNQETIARFKGDVPEIRAIVSTEAGSEGVNLQVANVLINFDLPWNPMIVEQRIGRIQRLGSDHQNVIIYNVILEDTFEEYIIARLMMKLQMATDAIGDIESLLEASGVGSENDDSSEFDDKIRELVLATLAGKNMESATRKIELSIDAAKQKLEEEKENIEATLGGMDGYEYVGPRVPTLSPPRRSMELGDFVRSAFTSLGSSVSDSAPGVLRIQTGSASEFARLQDDVDPRFTRAALYAPGSPSFLRLVDKITASGLHQVDDEDPHPRRISEQLGRAWADQFGGGQPETEVVAAQRYFSGVATVKVRAITAHDSYERLVDVPCDPADHSTDTSSNGIEALPDLISDPETIGLDRGLIVDAATRDADVSEFVRFYLERRAQEMAAAGGDVAKSKKLEEDFTPNIETTLVALAGVVKRRARAKVRYQLDNFSYESVLSIDLNEGEITTSPSMEECSLTGMTVPSDCLETCYFSKTRALRHRLVNSDFSRRYALPEHCRRCSLSGKQLLVDEVGTSDVTNALVDMQLLKTCSVTGKKAEPEYFGSCDFTNSEVLREKLAVSGVSNRLFREDQRLTSVVSGVEGHSSEFIICAETRQPLLATEAERCSVTGKVVVPGVLQICAESGKAALASELEASMVSGRRVLRSLLVTSSISEARFLEEEGIRSAYGKYCMPVEARRCDWSNVLTHPEDVRTCPSLGVSVHFQFLSEDTQQLRVVEELLIGTRRTADRIELWEEISVQAARIVNIKKCKIVAAEMSPGGHCLAVCAEFKSLLGLRTQFVGILYSLKDHAVIGRDVIVKRDKSRSA